MSKDGAPSAEPSKKDQFVSKIESARVSQEKVDAEQFTTQFDARMEGVDVAMIAEAIKKIDADLKNVPEGETQKYQDLEELKELVSNLLKMKQAPSLRGSILNKIAKSQIFDVMRQATVPDLDPKIQTALEGLSNAAYHIAQSHFPDQFKAQQAEEDERNEAEMKLKRDRLMKMNIS